MSLFILAQRPLTVQCPARSLASEQFSSAQVHLKGRFERPLVSNGGPVVDLFICVGTVVKSIALNSKWFD